MNIYYFDRPTAGYCPDCEKDAIYRPDKGGIVCPVNDKHTISIFVWEENSRHPEEDIEEEEEMEGEDE